AGRRQAILLRVTPGVEAHTHTYIQTGQADSKFGLSIEAGLAMAAVERADACDTLDLVGIHAHIGSNIFSYDPFGKTVEIMFDFLADVEKVLGLTVEEVNLGGGLGIPYIAGDFPIRLDLLAKLITETAEHEAARHAIPVRDATLPASVQRGDVLVVPATGAYGYSMASNYNRQPRPAVVLVKEGSAHTIVRRESLEDLFRLESPLP